MQAVWEERRRMGGQEPAQAAEEDPEVVEIDEDEEDIVEDCILVA